MNGPVAKFNIFFLTAVDLLHCRNFVPNREQKSYSKQNFICFAKEQFPLFLSIMLNWSIEDNLTLCIQCV